MSTPKQNITPSLELFFANAKLSKTDLMRYVENNQTNPDFNIDLPHAASQNMTPLMFAAREGLPENVEYLISKGANTNAVTRRNQTALHIAIVYATKCDPKSANFLKYLKTIEHLVNAPKTNVNIQDQDGSTPLMEAVCVDDIKIIDILATRKPNLELQLTEAKKRTAFLIAVSVGYLQVVQKLISMKVNLLARDDEDNTSIILTVSGKEWLPDVLETLLEHPHPDINHRNLMEVSEAGSKKKVRHFSALDYAKKGKKGKGSKILMEKIINTLIDNGAKESATDNLNSNETSEDNMTPKSTITATASSSTPKTPTAVATTAVSAAGTSASPKQPASLTFQFKEVVQPDAFKTLGFKAKEELLKKIPDFNKTANEELEALRKQKEIRDKERLQRIQEEVQKQTQKLMSLQKEKMSVDADEASVKKQFDGLTQEFEAYRLKMKNYLQKKQENDSAASAIASASANDSANDDALSSNPDAGSNSAKRGRGRPPKVKRK